MINMKSFHYLVKLFFVLLLCTACAQSDIKITTDAHFRNEYLLKEHYEKHGKYMGYSNAQDYEEGAQKVISNPDSLLKTEKEDGDKVYYLKETNEIVFVSQDDIIRTYFNPNEGIEYFNRQ